MTRSRRFVSNGREGLTVSVAACETPLVTFLVGASPEGVAGSGWGDRAFLEEMGILGYDVEPARSNSEAGKLALAGIHQVEEYFAGDRIAFDLPLCFASATAFGRHVLEEVAHRVPFGMTATYGEIAERASRPRAARAVGSIMARCPFSIIVPCHRIVHVQGWSDSASNRNNAWERRKEWLLHFEASTSVNRRP